MSNRKLQISLAASALLALGASTPLLANDLEPSNLERLRLVRGVEGVGYGSLVMPTYNELGELSANLYDEADRPVYWLDGSLSLYIAYKPIQAGRNEIGGFSGMLREAKLDNSPHPKIIGFVEGTWSMDGQGEGTISAAVFKLDGNDQWHTTGYITGEFHALELTVRDVNPAELGAMPDFDAEKQRGKREVDASSREVIYEGEQQDAGQRIARARRLASDSQVGAVPVINPSQKGALSDFDAQKVRGMQDAGDSQKQRGDQSSQSDARRIANARHFSFLRDARDAQRQLEASPLFSSEVQKVRNLTQAGDFGLRSADLERSIEGARRKALAIASQKKPFALSQIPVEPHLVGKVVLKFKVAK